MRHSVKTEIEILKRSRRGSGSSDNAEDGGIMLLFCKGKQKTRTRNFNAMCNSHCTDR